MNVRHLLTEFFWDIYIAKASSILYHEKRLECWIIEKFVPRGQAACGNCENTCFVWWTQCSFTNKPPVFELRLQNVRALITFDLKIKSLTIKMYCTAGQFLQFIGIWMMVKINCWKLMWSHLNCSMIAE